MIKIQHRTFREWREENFPEDDECLDIDIEFPNLTYPNALIEKMDDLTQGLYERYVEDCLHDARMLRELVGYKPASFNLSTTRGFNPLYQRVKSCLLTNN